MINIKNAFHFIENNINRHGLYKTAISVVYEFFKRIIGFNLLIIIVLDKNKFQKKKEVASLNHSFLYAAVEDLKNMQQTNEFNIFDQDMKALENGDLCLLHFVQDELAGYTWAHVFQSPTLVNGICLKIPENMIYNYKGFTHPKFRGKGLQSIRHHKVISELIKNNKTCLMGYVEITNWSSRKGQRKGGYEDIGYLYYISLGKILITKLSKSLPSKGISLLNYRYKIKNFYILNKKDNKLNVKN